MKLSFSLAALLVVSACLLAGCTGTEGLGSFGRPEVEPVAVVPDPPVIVGWECYWDPTMNDDWHDDYVCSDGSSFDRPSLIPGDSFVERGEIDEAAAVYEAELNS